MNEMHSDEQADVQLICQVLDEELEPVITVIKNILDKITAMDDELDGLAKVVNEEILGGITNLYNTHERFSGISSLSEKYGSLMGPYKDFYSELTNGKDIYEDLYEELEKFKKSAEEVDDSAVDSKVQELSNMLKAKFEKVRGMSIGEEKPVEVEVEIEKTAEAPKADELIEKIRKMKSKAGDVKF